MFYAIGIAVVLADQLAKWFVTRHSHDGPILGDLLRLTLTQNAGGAFGLFPGARAPFIAIGLAAAVVLAYASHRLRRGDPRRAYLGLILGGNLGNLVDRLRLGRVVDFIDMGLGSTRWPVYNLADAAVVVGAVGLAVLLLGEMLPPTTRPQDSPPAEMAPAPGPEERAADAR